MSSFRTLTRAMSTVPKHKVFSMQSLSPAMAKFGQIEWAKEIGATLHPRRCVVTVCSLVMPSLSHSP